MIRFECSACDKKLSVADELAGKLATCPSCKTKVRIPKPKKKAKPIEDEEDEEEGSWFNGNRIRGIVAIALAIGILIFALTFTKFRNPGEWEFGQYGTPIGCGLAGVMLLAGIFYLIRG